MAEIVQLVEQWTFPLEVLVQYLLPTQPGWGLTQPSIPLWVGKMSTSIGGEWRNNVHSQ